uniref:Uncharacterized protein n=1 Tax=Glossina austeni TaxID=7395 RepID=A0A1A9UQ32_GLOAU
MHTGAKKKLSSFFFLSEKARSSSIAHRLLIQAADVFCFNANNFIIAISVLVYFFVNLLVGRNQAKGIHTYNLAYAAISIHEEVLPEDLLNSNGNKNNNNNKAKIIKLIIL